MCVGNWVAYILTFSAYKLNAINTTHVFLTYNSLPKFLFGV